MLVIATALVPVFLLMMLGVVLNRWLLEQPTFWNGLERLVYYILFPALLVDTLTRAKFANVPIAGVGGALLLAVLVMSALCWALRRPLAAWWGVDGRAFSSLFQGATRWQTFVALSVCGNLYGPTGIALASVAMVAMIPLLNVFAVMVLARYAAPQRLKWPALLAAIAQNPLIWSCLIGIALNVSGLELPVWLHELLDSLGRCCLAIGLLVVGAGLQIETLRQSQSVAWLTVALKLLIMPLVALSLAKTFGVSGIPLAVVACCASVPSASNGYILAKQMGGDAPLLAQILMLQTVLAALTMPLVIAWATGSG